MKPLSNLVRLAVIRSRPVTVFDLETTTNIPHVKWFGITEVGMLTILPTGEITEETSLVDPERKIPPKVRELTGITDEDVSGKPTWKKWAPLLHRYASAHIMVGFNSVAFDNVAVVKQNARYGIEDTAIQFALDARALPDVAGKLQNAAGAFGITSGTYHRAMADVWVTAQLVEAVAERHGVAVLEQAIGKAPTMGGGSASSRKEREEELLAHYQGSGVLPDLVDFGTKHGIKKNTVEGDVERLIHAGDLPVTVLANPIVQDWLHPRVDEAILLLWVGEADGRLKPLFSHFEPDAPEGFNYTQLKLALARNDVAQARRRAREGK